MTTRTVAPAVGGGTGNCTSRVSVGDANHPHDDGTVHRPATRWHDHRLDEAALYRFDAASNDGMNSQSLVPRLPGSPNNI
ncbi:hypothetical protein [Burkholderia lata]|uniref:hypothetical protein n=1 Tax=Burkholderia lata (strain ATCC 17760 / DSM 23089 / LMG 22485 / NCIMB 9086 / R18194 / 383) TaxID=482957 RepID=UPI001582D3CA|nr:hypothetical protein [Burkholderia lata]